MKYLKQGFCAHRLIGLGAAYRFSLWLLFVICLPFVIPAISLYHSPFFSWPWWTSLPGPTLQNFFLSIASGRSLFGSKTQSSSVSNALSLVTSSRDQKHWLFLTPSAYWTSSVRIQQENLRGRRIQRWNWLWRKLAWMVFVRDRDFPR